MEATEDIGMYEAVGEKEMEIGKLTKLSYQKKEGFHRGVQKKKRYW